MIEARSVLIMTVAAALTLAALLLTAARQYSIHDEICQSTVSHVIGSDCPAAGSGSQQQ